MVDGGVIPEGARPWAEPDPSCEMLIRISPERSRSAAIWAETARRLGVSDG